MTQFNPGTTQLQFSQLLVPLVPSGSLFTTLTSTEMQVRWLQPADPVFYGALNRPLNDLALRQLVIAKSIDASIGSVKNAFPFVVQSQCKRRSIWR